MRGYSGDEMYADEDLDEYEEDGEGEEYEEGEEEEEEEEVRKPTKEELKYLELRQKLKDNVRKQMKKESGASNGNSLEKKKKLPYDNYGNFFGPSQPVIAPRVIQESKSLLETQHLAARPSSSHNGLQSKKPAASTTAGPRPGGRGPQPKVINEIKSKVQKLKDMRDYSFLMSDDAELPAPTKEPQPRNASVSNYEARSAQVPSKNKQSTSNPSRLVSNGREDRSSVPMNRQVPTKAGPHKVVSTSRPNLSMADPRRQLGSNAGNGPGRPMVDPRRQLGNNAGNGPGRPVVDPRRQLGSNAGNGPGRPMVPKGLTPKMQPPTKVPTSHKMQAPSLDRKASSMGIKKPVPAAQRAPSSKLHSSVNNQRLDQRREFREPERSKQVSKQMVSSSKPQMKPAKQMPQRPPMHVNRPKKRPVEQYSDDEDAQAISMIRNMFGYNPKRYAGDDEDDSDMEANFDDILREEKRSEKIAREEDERELRLIEEEERRERMRKEAKRRKLSQR